MSNSVKALLALVFLFGVLAAAAVVYTIPHWWYRVGNAVAQTAHGPLGTVTVFKSIEGNYLFLIKEDSLGDQYIFYPSTGKIGIPNYDHFVYLPLLTDFKVMAYSKDVPVPVVFSENRIKIETDMNIINENGTLRFETRMGRQVEANLNNY